MSPAVQTKAEADLQKLLEAVARVDVLDAADKVLANPTRHMTSAAAVIRMAIAVKLFWNVVLEADQLVCAIGLPVTGNDHEDTARDAAIERHTNEVRGLILAIYCETNEPTETNNAG